MTLARRVPVNFEKVLRFLTEHSKANTFLPYGFYEIYQLTLRSPMNTAYQKSGIRDPGPLGGTLSGTLRWDTGLGLYGRTLR